MSDALVRTLINRGEFDARLDARFAREAKLIVNGSPDQREARLEKLRDLHPDVRYVVTGSVTDFHHTDDVPRETRRRGLLLTRKREAVVAVQMDVIDLDAGRIVSTDHLHGTAPRPVAAVSPRSARIFVPRSRRGNPSGIPAR